MLKYTVVVQCDTKIAMLFEKLSVDICAVLEVCGTLIVYVEGYITVNELGETVLCSSPSTTCWIEDARITNTEAGWFISILTIRVSYVYVVSIGSLPVT